MELRLIQNREEADELIAFLLGEGMFPTPLTPGEKQVICRDPYDSLAGRPSAYWMERDAEGRILAGIGIREQANHTGIYELTCIAVAPGNRQKGLGKAMLEQAVRHIEDAGGRGMLVDTSDHPAYGGMHALLRRCGFTRVGHLPDFYFPGEGTHLYYRLLRRPGDAR